MNNKIQIANLLLTRRCNLKCDMCRISGDLNYVTMPKEYPTSDYYYKNEQPGSFWVDVISRLLKHNPNIFIIVYGGESMLHPDIAMILKHLKTNNANYTMITNCHPTMDKLYKNLFKEVGTIKGFSASVDPGFYLDIDKPDDEQKKSHYGFDMLKKLKDKGLITDPVAEMTVSKDNIHLVEESIKRLSEEGIYTDLTVIDIAMTNYYDFSTVTDPKLLVPKTQEVRDLFDRLKQSDYLIHMKKILLDGIYDIMPAELDCKLGEGNLHNITIDSDDSCRLCLRIRGRFSTQFTLFDLFNPDGTDKISKLNFEQALAADKKTLCKGCNWTCPIMSAMDQNLINEHI